MMPWYSDQVKIDSLMALPFIAAIADHHHLVVVAATAAAVVFVLLLCCC